jgi:hypothetical protein
MKRKNLLKIALSLIFVVFALVNTQAQQDDKPLTYGFRIGTNSSGFTQNYEVFTQSKLGFTGGGFIEYQPIKMAGISIEVNYSQQGAYHFDPNYIYTPAELSDGTNKIYSDIKLQTIEVPLLFNFRPLTEGNITPVFSLGFAFDYILSASSNNWVSITDANNFTYTLPTTNKEDVSSRFQSYNYGPVGGLGIDFIEKQIKYSIGVRYSIGLNDIDNSAYLNNVTSNYYRFHYSSNTLSVLIGIGF